MNEADRSARLPGCLPVHMHVKLVLSRNLEQREGLFCVVCMENYLLRMDKRCGQTRVLDTKE